MTKRTHTTRSGFTLLELVLTASILSLILAVSISLMATGMRASSRTATQGSMQHEARSAVERIARDLKDSGENATGWEVGEDPDPADQFYGKDATKISFSRCTGYDPAADLLSWGPVVGYEFVAADGDQPGRIVRSEGGAQSTVCDYVSAFTVRYESAGSMVVITVTLARADPEQFDHTITASYSTCVKLRN